MRRILQQDAGFHFSTKIKAWRRPGLGGEQRGKGEGEVVDTVLAKPWRLSYMPKAPAQYVVETDPSLLELIAEGDHLHFTRLSE